jgi:hypothetical protein
MKPVSITVEMAHIKNIPLHEADKVSMRMMFQSGSLLPDTIINI